MQSRLSQYSKSASIHKIKTKSISSYKHKCTKIY